MTDLRKLVPAGDNPRKVADVVNEAVDALNYGQLRSRTVAQLADITPVEGRHFFCTDETGGAITVFGDGTNWRRLSDRNIVS